MRPAYRTGSSSEALSAARRTQLNRGLGLVAGVFLTYALASCFLPGLLPMEVYGGLRVGELFALAQVLVIAAGVLTHDRHARRHIEPLAARVATREPAFHAEESHRSGTAAASSAPTHGDPDADEFNAFDSSRAFGGRRTGRAVRATT
ncbi:hypothetical protein DB35_04210 [Streptomyces abyssalis]|uniref:DUF485 domain-containing protein n=1 Tax=Streptomyces abyssalis TaxID=933944 RepID=A0A1E7JQ64_9ACTN|nr:DUF485 domain-containing protein [Streptomyces abyssalis]OEU90431.1 hypothetical protein AN215_13315 [Streptomyces abyssalis]OEU95167.1 hypothetical protein DB35_04210 [Streptomyces abyssalis]